MPLKPFRSSFLIALVVAGCPKTETPEGFDRRVLLRSIADQVVLPQARDFVVKADALALATSALSDGAAAGDDTTRARAEARSAWVSAMDAWQLLEPIQVGPAGKPSDTIGGLALRDEIYAWPEQNDCAIDIAIDKNEFGAEGWFDRQLVFLKGLRAIEYVLFREDDGNACAGPAVINESGSWAALGAPEIRKRRAAYAHRAARAVAAKALALRTAWEATGGDFAGKLSTAGAAGSPYLDAKEALDEVFAALFYADHDTKTAKLADPSGISEKCTTGTCPALLESRWSKRGKENLVANIEGIRRVVLGGPPDAKAANAGFDDFLAASNAGTLAADMDAALVNAIAKVQAIEGPMEEALSARFDQVSAAHDAVKGFTDLFKSQFVTTLNLAVPLEAQGDND